MGRYWEILGDTGRYGEIWGETGRNGEIWGDLGRSSASREAVPRLLLQRRVALQLALDHHRLGDTAEI